MTSTDILRQQLADVAARRELAETLTADVNAKYKAFEQTIAAELAAAATARNALAEAENGARALIVAIYQTTGEKQPAEGAAVRLTTKLQYDKDEAFAKAKAMGVAIVPEALDVKAFEKIAKASPDSFPFVQVVEEPSATLASDLSVYLATAPARDIVEVATSEVAETPF